MPSLPRSMTSAMRCHIFWANASNFVIFAGVAWGLVLVVFAVGLFGFEVRGSYGLGSVIDIRFATIFASVITVVVIAIVLPLIFRAMRLAKQGVQASGTIRQQLGVTWRSIATVRVSYMFNEQAYTIKVPLGEHPNSVGTKVELIVDPQCPGRSMLRENVFPPGFDVEA